MTYFKVTAIAFLTFIAVMVLGNNLIRFSAIFLNDKVLALSQDNWLSQAIAILALGFWVVSPIFYYLAFKKCVRIALPNTQFDFSLTCCALIPFFVALIILVVYFIYTFELRMW